MIKLPEVVERDYMRFRRSVVKQVGAVANDALDIRIDSEDDPEFLALLALLGLTPTTIIDGRALRRKLRRFADRISDFERAQLSAFFGRYVHLPNPALLEEWIEEQALAVEKSAASILDRAALALGSLAVGAAAKLVLANQIITPEEGRVAVAASGAALALNARLAQSIALNAGSTHYRWITEDDEVVRDWHAELHFTVQAWASPPLGGGTKEDEEGHPGSGFGCRCTAEPVARPS